MQPASEIPQPQASDGLFPAPGGAPPRDSGRPFSRSGKPEPHLSEDIFHSGKPISRSGTPEPDLGKDTFRSGKHISRSGKPEPKLGEDIFHSGKPARNLSRPFFRSGEPEPSLSEPFSHPGRPFSRQSLRFCPASRLSFRSGAPWRGIGPRRRPSGLPGRGESPLPWRFSRPFSHGGVPSGRASLPPPPFGGPASLIHPTSGRQGNGAL